MLLAESTGYTRVRNDELARLLLIEGKAALLLDALEIRVRPEQPMWKTGGQQTLWIEDDEHKAAVALLASFDREPIGGSNPDQRARNVATSEQQAPAYIEVDVEQERGKDDNPDGMICT